MNPSLELKIRWRLQKPTEFLNDDLLLSVDTIYTPPPPLPTLHDEILNEPHTLVKKSIKTIEGIEKCLNLKYVDLSYNEIEDISPLSHLSKLTHLDLKMNFRITNIQPLANLNQLRYLDIFHNQIHDISSLDKLLNLETLYIDHNPITDISVVSNFKLLERLRAFDTNIEEITALSQLKNLQYIQLSNCNISNINPLQGLIEIHLLSVSYNNIEDISPLINNTGIAKGDTVYLAGNPLNQLSINSYIPILKARGATIFY